MDLLQWSINFLIKKLLVAVLKNKVICNKELAEELHKPIIRKFQKRKGHSFFIDNIWGTRLGDVQLISKLNKEFRFGKYACVILLKDQKRNYNY